MTSGMSGKTFVDTSVLIYAHDVDAGRIAVAIRSGAIRVLSEDLNAGQAIAGVIIENPFGG